MAVLTTTQTLSPHPFLLSLSLSLSVHKCSLSNTDFPNPRFPETPKNPQFHNHPSLSLSLSLFLCACSRSSLQSSECVCSLCFFRSFSLSIFLVLAQVSRPDDRSIPDMAEGKLDLPDDLLSSKPSDHSWSAKGTTYYHYFTTLFSLFTSFFCFQCLSVLFFFFLLLDLRTYLMDLIDADSMRGLGLC